MTIGGKRYGAAFGYMRDADNCPCIYGTIWWLKRDGMLGYRYPSVTLERWRLLFGWQ